MMENLRVTETIAQLDQPMNHRFTYSYSQPPEYHFCLDSVIFPKFIAEEVAHKVHRGYRALDLCAGCGVIGFEFAHYLPQIQFIDFLEVQPLFRSHFEDNLKITGRSDQEFRFLEMNYADLLLSSYANSYDLILGNPPYFFIGDGKISPSQVKNRCRFFLDSSFETLVQATLHTLKPGGEGYLLIKTGDKHGRNTLGDAQTWIGDRANIERVADIRGTSVVRIIKDEV